MNPVITEGEMCAFHPDRPAVDRCTECASAICAEDRTEVAGKTVCQSCVQAIRARVAAQMASEAEATAAPRYNFSTPSTSAQTAPQPIDMVESIDPATPPAPVAAPGSILHLFTGVVAGSVVGVIGAFIYDKFVFFTHIQFGLISSLIGWAVGVAVVVIGRRVGWLPAILSGLIAFFSMILSYHLLFNDMLARQGSTDRISYDPIGTLTTIINLDIMDWVFIAIGVYGAGKVALRAARR